LNNSIAHQQNFFNKFFTLTSGTLGAYILPIIFLPILTRIYNPNEFSLYAIYITIVQIISMFSTFKFDLAIPITSDYKDRTGLLRISILIMFSLTFIISLLLIVLSIFFEAFPILLVSLIPSGIILHCVYTHILYNWLLSKRKLKHISIGKIIFGVLSSSLPVFIFIFFNLKGYFYIILSHQFSLLFILFLVLINIYGSTFFKTLVSVLNFKIDEFFRIFKKYKKYAIFSSPSSLMNIFGIWFPVLFFWFFFDEKYVSLFFLSHRAVSFPLQILGDSIGRIFYSEAAENIKEGILDEVITKYFNLLFHIAFPFIVISIVFSPNIFNLIFDSNWSEASLFVQILSPLFFIRLLGSPLSTIPTILYKQEVEFRFQLILFFVRLITLIIGVFSEDVLLTLILFSMGSAFCWLFYLLVILKMGGITIYSLLVNTFRTKIKYLSLILIFSILISFLITNNLIMFLSMIILISYFCYSLFLEIKKI
tara:strand:+ start:7270 stop:8709 length:1440 start_codon:yes stop_codon:yes gene_type:complete